MVTIKDVAREAGVSVGTASQALRESPAVRDATRRRVQAVAKRLRYQPSALARGLVTRRTHTVGLLISDIANPFFIRAVRAIEDGAQENGYNVILCNTDEDPAKETQYLRVLIEKRVDGIILATTAGSLPGGAGRPLAADSAGALRPRAAPSSPSTPSRWTACSADAWPPSTSSASATAGSPSSTARWCGPPAPSGSRGTWMRCGPAGLQPDPALIREGNFKQESGRELARQLLELSPPPTALFCTNNLMTVGALQTLGERGVRMPADLSLDRL